MTLRLRESGTRAGLRFGWAGAGAVVAVFAGPEEKLDATTCRKI